MDIRNGVWGSPDHDDAPHHDETPSSDEAYATVSEAMEAAFLRARAAQSELGVDELLVSILLLKDRLLEQHIDVGLLSPHLAEIARRLYEI